MKVHRLWILTITCFTIFTSSIADEPRIVCYYTNWSIYRPDNAKYSPQNINPYLCTHLIYAFGGFTKDNTLQPFDKYQDIEKGGYAKFTGLKTYNKNLKTLLAIGGWNEGSARFSPLVGNAERRREFVKNTVKYLRQNHFDGLDLDWEYPTFRDGGKSKDRANYAQLVQELSEEFDRESSKTGRTRLLLTLAIPAGIDKIDKGYDIVKLNQYLDWFNVLTYDYHDSFEPATNHHAPLYSLEEDNEYNYDSELNIDFSVKHLINAGADRQKLVLGIPTYGRSYTLFNSDANEIGAPTDGPGEPGDATREKGFLAYYEICENIKSDDEWIVMHPNDKAMGPYSYKNDQWISYDDEKMARKKAMYVAENNLGGIMFWSIDTDDFRGTCSGKPYPLIEAAKEGLLGASSVIKTNESNVPPRKTTTRNRNRPNAGQQNQAPSNVKDKFNRRRKPSLKTTIRPTTRPSIIYNSKTTTPEPPTTPDPGSDFKCEEDGFFPHPRDCKKYFWCLDSGPSNLGIVAHQFTCPSGLVFNKQADSCDYTRNVVCSKTNPPATTAKPPATTTYKTTTKLSTTQRTTTFKTTTNPPTTTSTTPAYEEDDEEFEYENENPDPERDIEDPKVIKELIDLIKKAGGIEELEKHLKFTDESLPVLEDLKSDKLSTTQSTFSKSLYDKFLKRKQLENRFVKTENANKVKPDTSELRNENLNSAKVDSTRYSSVIRNSRPNPQNAGLENLPEFEGFLKEKPQYVTIQRFRSTTEIIQDNDNSHELHDDDEEEEYSYVETATKSPSQPQYVNIRRNRFTTLPTNSNDDETDKFVQNPLSYESVTNTPQYTTINRRRKPDVRDQAEILPVFETDSTTIPAVEISSTMNARTQTRYKPISRTSTATPLINIAADVEAENIESEHSTKPTYESRDEELETSTEAVFAPLLNSGTKYQNFNRRTLIKTSLVETTSIPINEDDVNIPQTTVVLAADFNYDINVAPKEPSTEIVGPNINNPDELTTPSAYTNVTTTNYYSININNDTTINASHSNETMRSDLNDITTNNNKNTTLLQVDEVTVKNATEFITTQLSSPSPFELQTQNNQTSTAKETITFSVKDIDRVTDYSTNPTIRSLKLKSTTTTNKPTILQHIFAIDYNDSVDEARDNITDLGQREFDTSTYSLASKEEISKRLEKLVEINRIVVIHSKQEAHKIKSDSTDLMVEKNPAIDKIGEISRWVSVKLQNNNLPINSTFETENRFNVLDPKIIFDVETSTIPLEGLFDQTKIFIENHLTDNEVIDYQIIKPPLEINPIHSKMNDVTETPILNQYHNNTILLQTDWNEANSSSVIRIVNPNHGVERIKSNRTGKTIKFTSNGGESTESPNQRQHFNLRQIHHGKLKDTKSNDFVVNSNENNETGTVTFQANPERQVNVKPNTTTIGQTSSTTIRPFVNFRKKVLPPRISPSVLRKKTSFTTSTTQPSINVNNLLLQKTTPKIVIRRKLYSRPGTAVTKPIIESTTVNSDIDSSTEQPKRTRKPPTSYNSKFVRPLRIKYSNNSIPQGNISTVIDDQFLSQTITTNNKQLVTGLNKYNNSSFIDDEISDILKAMSKTPLPVTTNDNKSRQTVRNKPINRRPSKPITKIEEMPIKTTTEGRRKVFQKIQATPPDNDRPKILPKLPNDYDYYDDGESLIGQRDNSQVKVVLHETGAIECLDQGNFPHPLSCKKFISCAKIETGGVAGWEYTCPKGLNYDPVGGICNWATGLGCKD